MEIKDLIKKISYGNVLLFVGSGFSNKSKNVLNDSPPSVDKLIEEIKKLGNIEENDLNLKDISDYYIEDLCKFDPKKKTLLIEKLKDLYTIKHANEIHKTIVSLPWRKIYTTNYDNLIEFAGSQINKRIQSITIDDSTSEYYTKANGCVHINGYIETLGEDNLNTKFKLSHSSYLSSDSFVNSKWYYSFRQDLEHCSAIVFIGYSLYDIEIEKLLYDNEIFREKAFFIKSQSNMSIKDKKFERYGTVYKIGTDGFVNEINNSITLFEETKKEFFLEAFEEYNIKDFDTNIEKITTSQIVDFLYNGKLSDNYIINGITTEQKPPFLIERFIVDEIINELKSYSKPICVLSNFANGKTIFLKELALKCMLNSLGRIVWLSSTDSKNYLQDLEKIVKSNQDFIIFIDDYGFYLDFLEHYSHLSPKNTKLILTERFTNHRRLEIENINSIQMREFVIDKLNEEESRQFSKILQTTALDIKKAGKSEQEKMRYLQNDLNSEISSVLADLLKAPQIIERTKKATTEIFKSEDLKSMLFALCILETMNIPISYALISEISFCDNIFSKLNKSKEIEELFHYESFDNLFKIKSSIFAKFLIENLFGENPNYIVEQCLKILVKLEQIGSSDIDRYQKEIRVNLLKFNFIENILPRSKKRNMLVKYYESIKRELPRHEKNPHFWLQFGMAHIALEEYEDAEKFLKYGYEQSKNREDYNTDYLDTQKARLLLKKASLGAIKQEESIKFFIEADNLLAAVPNNMYKYKIVSEYYNYFNTMKNLLSNKNKNIVMQASRNRLREIEKVESSLDTFNAKQDRVLIECKARLNTILKGN